MNLFKMMGALKDIGKLSDEMKAQAEQLAGERFEATVGSVSVVANGAQQLLSCRIAPEALAAGDADRIESDLLAAANDALRRSRERAAELMQAHMKDRFDLPGMDGVFKGLLGK